MTADEINVRNEIIECMKAQGFQINPHLQVGQATKQAYKRIQHNARMAQISEHGRFLKEFMPRAREHAVSGSEIDIREIKLELREVMPDSFESRLFFWWNLAWWSMPYQPSYGRQMRFMLWDATHDAPFGLIQLQSPLLRMRTRDEYLGITSENAEKWANMSMNAQRVGALPPYNGILGGKMTALAMTAREIGDAYVKKYKNRRTVMKDRIIPAKLLFITTTSAFGRSSIYDRLRYHDTLAAVPIGYTDGTGTFHMPADLTRKVYAILRDHGMSTATGYGHGPSRKVKLLKRAFQILDLKGFHTHGIRREVYLFPLVSNLSNVIHKKKRPVRLNRGFASILEYWRDRWAVPRDARMPEWKKFDPEPFFAGIASMI